MDISEWVSGVAQKLSADLLRPVIIAVGTAVMAWLKSREWKWTEPLLYGLITAACLFILLGGIGQGTQGINEEEAKIKAWGPTNDPGAYAVFEIPRTLSKFKGNHRLALICRADDPTVDFYSDRIIDKSGLFEVPAEGGTVMIGVTYGVKTKERLSSANGFVGFVLVLVPTTTQWTEVSSVNDVLIRGGKVLGQGGFAISYVTPPPS